MKYYISMLCLLLPLSACRIEPACQNENPILQKHLPAEEPYKAELARLIDEYGGDRLMYYVEGYSEVDGVPQIDIHIENKDICATFTMMVTEPDEDIKNIIHTKGEGYFNAQLYGLKFSIVKRNGKTLFLYKDMNFVID